MTTCYTAAKDLIVDYLSELDKDDATELASVYKYGGIEAAMNWIRNECRVKIVHTDNKWILIE